MANKSFHLTTIPLRSIVAGELNRMLLKVQWLLQILNWSGVNKEAFSNFTEATSRIVYNITKL